VEASGSGSARHKKPVNHQHDAHVGLPPNSVKASVIGNHFFVEGVAHVRAVQGDGRPWKTYDVKVHQRAALLEGLLVSDGLTRDINGVSTETLRVKKTRHDLRPPHLREPCERTMTITLRCENCTSWAFTCAQIRIEPVPWQLGPKYMSFRRTPQRRDAPPLTAR
jgi:hypothetical protein